MAVLAVVVGEFSDQLAQSRLQRFCVLRISTLDMPCAQLVDDRLIERSRSRQLRLQRLAQGRIDARQVLIPDAVGGGDIVAAVLGDARQHQSQEFGALRRGLRVTHTTSVFLVTIARLSPGALEP